MLIVRQNPKSTLTMELPLSLLGSTEGTADPGTEMFA